MIEDEENLQAVMEDGERRSWALRMTVWVAVLRILQLVCHCYRDTRSTPHWLSAHYSLGHRIHNTGTHWICRSCLWRWLCKLLLQVKLIFTDSVTQFHSFSMTFFTFIWTLLFMGYVSSLFDILTTLSSSQVPDAIQIFITRDYIPKCYFYWLHMYVILLLASCAIRL